MVDIQYNFCGSHYYCLKTYRIHFVDEWVKVICTDIGMCMQIKFAI